MLFLHAEKHQAGRSEPRAGAHSDGSGWSAGTRGEAAWGDRLLHFGALTVPRPGSLGREAVHS